MSFDTLNYYLFFPLFFFVYWAFPHKWRIPLMLASSYYFYSCIKPIYLVLIITSTLIDYICSNKMQNSVHKKKYLYISLIINLGLLSLFKYLDFAINVSNDLLALMGSSLVIPEQNLEFPIGISFYTLQTLSYTFDVYRGTIPAEKNIFKFSLFVCFFPQLVAGPLERAGKLLPQFKKRHHFSYENAIEGAQLIVWGLIKKTVVSDRLVVIIADIFKNEHETYSGMHYLITGIMITAKFYGDFSGYSDMAVGSAKMLGFNLSKNFDFPFFSTSITKIWRRWHLTLSKWFHDYVYLTFPFDKNNRSDPRRILALMTVFALSGLWHGPAWTFIIWGSVNGLLCVLYILSRNLRNKISVMTGFSKIPKIMKDSLSVALTNSLVGFTMIFFMSPNLSFSLEFFARMYNDFAFIDLSSFLNAFGTYKNDFLIAMITITLIELLNLARKCEFKFTYVRDLPTLVRWPVYISAVWFILLLSYKEKSAFSYFYY